MDTISIVVLKHLLDRGLQANRLTFHMDLVGFCEIIFYSFVAVVVIVRWHFALSLVWACVGDFRFDECRNGLNVFLLLATVVNPQHFAIDTVHKLSAIIGLKKKKKTSSICCCYFRCGFVTVSVSVYACLSVNSVLSRM